jgi:hypothetical protein
VTQVDEGPESPEAPGVEAPRVLTVGTPTVGEVLAERYELQEHINDDAFGRQVWRGADVILRRPVAVVMRYPGGAAAIEMLDAAVAASRVVHPHLVDVYDAIDEGDRAYVVREWVDGGSLREYVADGPLDADRATSVACAIAQAVAAIHATGMAHGNIHAGTVLIGTDGRVVLSDARADEATTPDADVRAVGAVLYCALTGHWPHAEAGASSLPDAVRDESDRLIAPRQVRGGVPGHLSDLATDLLDPDVAPPSADVLAADLSRLEGDREEEFFSTGPTLLDFDQSGYPGTPVPERHRSVRKLVIGVAVLLVLSLVGLLLAINALGGPKPGGTTTSPTAGAATGTTPGKANGQPVVLKLNPNQIRVVDPDGDGKERKDAALAIDGDPGTSWKSNHYRESNAFPAYKRGMGLLLDLGAAKSVASVKIQFGTPGAMVSLRTATGDPGDSGDKALFDATTEITPPQVANGGTIVLTPASQDPVRYLMVWISKLPPTTDQGQYIVQVQEITVSVNG